MPWHIETDHAGCDGYAVVKDEGSELVGCHRTRTQALDQLAALNIAEPQEDRAEGYPPTDGMVEEAQRGLDWRQEHGRGGTEIGVARARDIINRRNLPLDTVNRMVSYFARHEVDKEGEGWSPGEPGFPSAGRIAWALWGGDPGRTWAESIANQNRAGTGPTAIITDIDGTLISDAGANQELLDYLDESDAIIVVITGRPATRRAETEALLARLDLDYDLLEMSRGGDPNAHKKAVATRLLDRFTIDEAFDDNPDARAAYADLGIQARPPRSNRAVAAEILAHLHRVR